MGETKTSMVSRERAGEERLNTVSDLSPLEAERRNNFPNYPRFLRKSDYWRKGGLITTEEDHLVYDGPRNDKPRADIKVGEERRAVRLSHLIHRVHAKEFSITTKPEKLVVKVLSPAAWELLEASEAKDVFTTKCMSTVGSTYTFNTRGWVECCKTREE